MIEVSNLTQVVQSKTILHDVSFSIADNQVVGFLGPNGAGKTTTMRVITGYYPPSSGVVKIDGYDVTKDLDKARRHLGYLPETVPLYDDLTVDEYLNFMARLMKVAAKERKEHVASILRKTGLYDVQRKLIKTLSRGYKQRVGIAQALIGDPQVLILDEPTVGLDPVQIKEIRDLIKSLAASKTVVLSTHILPEVTQICSRVLIINKGKIVADGAVNELLAENPEKPRIKVIFKGDAEELRRAVQRIGGVSVADTVIGDENEATLQFEKDCRSEVLASLVQSKLKVLEFGKASKSLEDLFVQVVTKE
ncbi:MAG: ABC transporter ATP-binding protein [Patescibacteria group bacterium]|nr:MAG: ABC transporter ATP-binding protein [Patescibacteria group bacterium]